MKDFCVLLDNGHGKETPGKSSPAWTDGTPRLYEWEYTRDITKRIEKKLKNRGVRVVRITPEDQDIGLTNRANRANQYAQKYRCVMVSVHCNAANKPNTGTGWEVWTTKAKNNSDKLAECFLDRFRELFPDWRLRGHKENNYTVIYKTNCPCVLTENFFMDNISDCQMMLSEEGRDKIAELHVRAVLDFQKKYYPDTLQNSTVLTGSGCHVK